ncbi:hypothetical protein FZEAL_10961, partial [Fusarium zealandicum]
MAIQHLDKTPTAHLRPSPRAFSTIALCMEGLIIPKEEMLTIGKSHRVFNCAADQLTFFRAPIDEKHTDAMDIHHHVLTLASEDKLYLAPLKKDIERALEIGTGT